MPTTRHLDDAAQTAVGPMTIVAVDQHEDVPLVRDKLAYRLLPTSAKAVAALAAVAPVRRHVIAATESKLPGLWSSILCRKRYIDHQLRAAVHDGIEVAVVLGAGLDTRAYRVPGATAIRFYEVDLPGNSERKRELIDKVYGKVPDHVTLVAADLETQRPIDALAARGYKGAQRAIFVCEGLTQYLCEDAVRRIFSSLSAAPSGSRLVFTYVRKDFLDGTALHGAERAYREYVLERDLWHFGFNPGHVASFLAEYGWRELEQVGPGEYAERYLGPLSRPSPVSEIELSVLAEKM